MWPAAVAFSLVLLCVVALGYLKCYRLQAVVANLAVIIPANAIITVLYITLTPVRWIYYQWLNMKVTTVVSLYTIRPSFWEADWDKLLDSFPIGYWAILNGVDILSLSPAEAEDRLNYRANGIPFPEMRSCISAVLPPWIVQSLLFRLALAISISPLLAWWLIGFTYIPILPIFEAAQEDEGGNGEEGEPPQEGHTLVMEIPECKFLMKAREKYGTEKGNLACLNE